MEGMHHPVSRAGDSPSDRVLAVVARCVEGLAAIEDALDYFVMTQLVAVCEMNVQDQAVVEARHPEVVLEATQRLRGLARLARERAGAFDLRPGDARYATSLWAEAERIVFHPGSSPHFIRSCSKLDRGLASEEGYDSDDAVIAHGSAEVSKIIDQACQRIAQWAPRADAFSMKTRAAILRQKDDRKAAAAAAAAAAVAAASAAPGSPCAAPTVGAAAPPDVRAGRA